jgi:DNA-binding transcriptional LysR family regulator
MRSTLSRPMLAEGLALNIAVEAFGSELQLSLVARGLGIGLASPEVRERSPHRESLQVIDATDFESMLNIWLVHAALPGRLVRPVALMRDALEGVLGDEPGVGVEKVRAAAGSAS